MSNPPPPSDSSASQEPPAPLVHADPWNLRDTLTFLPPPLQQLVNIILGHCHVDCSEDIEGANAITRELHGFLEHLVADLQSANLCCGLRRSVGPQGQNLLGRLTEGINRHFLIRPRIVVTSADADMQSAAAASRRIKECFSQLLEVLCADEERAGNIAPLTIMMMDSEDDPEISMRLAILDNISRHVVASFQQSNSTWVVKIDGESQCSSSSGSNSHQAPQVLEFADAAVAAAAFEGLENFPEAICCFCQSTVFEHINGIVELDAREMKCEGRHTVHSNCLGVTGVIDWFVEKKHNTCPNCRHDFSDFFSTDIEANLEHRQPNGIEIIAHWSKPPNLRLAALNLLAQLPHETPLGHSTASALLWSCLDASSVIANASLRSERLSAAIEVVPPVQVERCCGAVVEALKNAETEGTRTKMARAISQFTTSDTGCIAVEKADGCGAIVQSLKVAVTDEVIGSIALAIQHLVENKDCGIRCFRQFSEHSVCSYLAAALAIVSNDEARLTIANCMSLIFDTAALSVEDYSAHKIDHLKTLCSSKGISNSGNKKELVARLSELGTIEQKKLLLQGISQSNSTDICKELFVAMSHSASEKTFSKETLLSVLEVMKAIICDNNSDGAAKMFQVNGISHAFIAVLNSSLHSNDVIRSVGRVLTELLFHVGSASTTDCESFFECASHLGEALVSAWAHSKDDGTKQQISDAICDLSAAAQRFQGCQEIVEIKCCKNSSVPELDAAFKLVLVAPRIESNQVKKVIRNVVPKFVKGWNEPDHAPQRWRLWTNLSYAQQARIDNDDENSEVPIVSEEQVITLVTALQKSKGNVDKYSNISLAIAIIANVSQCMDRFIKCADILECFPGENRKHSCFPKSGSIEYSDIFEAIWMGMISASDRRWSGVCSGLCSHIGSMLVYVRYQGKACRPHLDRQNHNCRSFFRSFTAVCSSRGSAVCSSLIYALISTCSGKRTEIIDDDDDDHDDDDDDGDDGDVANIVQGMLYCIKNSEPSLKLFDRDKQFRDALLTAVKSTRATPFEISDWSKISGGMVPRSGMMSSRMTTHRAVAKIIDSLNSQELFVSSLQAATSAEEKFRLACCMANCNVTSIKSSPACKQVIAELISVLNYARDRHDIIFGVSYTTGIQKLIQELDDCDELIEQILHEIEHLVASVQAAPSAADISRLAHCMTNINLKQREWNSDSKSFRKRGIDALTAALKSISIKVPMPNPTAASCDHAIRHVSNALLNFIGETGCGPYYDVFKPLSALAVSLASVGNETDKCDVVLSISKIGCKMTADQKSSQACKQVIAELISVLKHRDISDWCITVIVDAIHVLDGCNELIIALSSAACDSERARLSSAIVTITQRRLKDSAHSESSSSANKKQKIGGAFSP